MSNNLKKLSKEFKAFAKRSRHISYTDYALFTFLLTGGLVVAKTTVDLSSTNNAIVKSESVVEKIVDFESDSEGQLSLSIEKATNNPNSGNGKENNNNGISEKKVNEVRKGVETSISDIKTSFRQAKRENDKLIKEYNLELIQLMEQGDYAVKSPWSSWQFGANYMYQICKEPIKGNGDKIPDKVYELNSNYGKIFDTRSTCSNCVYTPDRLVSRWT